MYGFIWRHLPGPAWLKAIESLILIASATFKDITDILTLVKEISF